VLLFVRLSWTTRQARNGEKLPAQENQERIDIPQLASCPIRQQRYCKKFICGVGGFKMKSVVVIKDIEIDVFENDKQIHINEVAEIPHGLEQEITARYPDCEVWFMYHNTPAPTERLRTITTLLDDCIDMRLLRNDFIPADLGNVFQISDDENFQKFADAHNKIPDMYWTSSRIKDSIRHWGIFMSYTETAETGYVIIRTDMGDPKQAEIFSLQAANTAQSRALLTAAVQYVFNAGKTEVVYMVERDAKSDDEQNAASSVGFQVCGFYQGYRLKGTSK